MAGPVWSNALLCPEPVEGSEARSAESTGRRRCPYCYILRCADASYYVGSTHDLPARLSKHAEGSASGYTAVRRPITLVYSEEFAAIDDARSREQQIKGWTRAKKDALIAGEVGRLKTLSRSNSSRR